MQESFITLSSAITFEVSEISFLMLFVCSLLLNEILLTVASITGCYDVSIADN